MADYAPVRGCMIVRPYGWSLWENIQKSLDGAFKATGHVDKQHYLFIYAIFLKKKKNMSKASLQRLAVVTIGGGEKIGRTTGCKTNE